MWLDFSNGILGGNEGWLGLYIMVWWW
jgi:hypothetical protein